MDQNSIVFDDLQGLERLTEKAKKTIVQAFEIANNFNNTKCEPIHLFIALLKDNAGIPATVLSKLGVDVDSTIQSLEQKLVNFNSTTDKITPDFSEDLKELINRACILVQRMSHVYVGTEHLLMAIVQSTQFDFVAELQKVGI